MPVASQARQPLVWRMMPALVLIALAPTFTELLLGGTRLTAIIGFPPIVLMELVVWGGGAALLRGLARKRELPPGGLVLLGLAIACAEEFVIQQTSFAPLVIKLRGVEWGRAASINYVYALWALGYETAWVLIAPTVLSELVFAQRRASPWLSGSGVAVLLLLFPVGAVAAWFGWTHIARVKTFHLPLYQPPAGQLLGATAVIAALISWALIAPPRLQPAKPPSPTFLAVVAGCWSVLWYALALLAFGIAPSFPAPAVFVGALALSAAAVVAGLRWSVDPDWTDKHAYAAFAGALSAAMLVTFVGFQGAAPIDIGFKVVTNLVASAGLIWFARQLRRRENLVALSAS